MAIAAGEEGIGNRFEWAAVRALTPPREQVRSRALGYRRVVARGIDCGDAMAGSVWTGLVVAWRRLYCSWRVALVVVSRCTCLLWLSMMIWAMCGMLLACALVWLLSAKAAVCFAGFQVAPYTPIALPVATLAIVCKRCWDEARRTKAEVRRGFILASVVLAAREHGDDGMAEAALRKADQLLVRVDDAGRCKRGAHKLVEAHNPQILSVDHPSEILAVTG